MSINFHVTGKERKALVEALSEITFSEAAYAGAPTFAYRVGDYTVDKNGVIFYPPTLAQEAVALVVEKLKERGFIPEGEAQADLPKEDAPAEIPAPGKLKFGLMISTLMAGPEANMKYESLFLNALNRTKSYEITGRELKLFGADGKVLMNCVQAGPGVGEDASSK